MNKNCKCDCNYCAGECARESACGDSMDQILERMGDTPIKNETLDECFDCSCCNPNFPIPSKRGTDWLNFSLLVLDHIENYTVPQYGDKGIDQVTEFYISDFKTQIQKYLNRFGKNARPGQDQLDLLKIAHYTQMLHERLNSIEKD